MNRIQLLDQQSPLTRPSAGSRDRRRRATYGSTGRGERSFFVPLHYEPNYAYPLLVWLHGVHDDPCQLKKIMPHVSVRNYVAVAPAVPLVPSAASNGSRDACSDESLCLAALLERIDEAIDQARGRFNIAPHRIFLAGCDAGGTLALRVGMAAVRRLAGVASVGGPFPQGGRPLANLQQARRLPVLISHGRDSDIYPVQRVCQELRLFHAAGLSVNVRQYPCGHELTTQMLADLNAWMMEIVTGSGAASSAAPRPYSRDEPN